MDRINKQQQMLRIRNCLQTILDLEKSLTGSELESLLLKEFLLLREAFMNMDEMSVLEDDVERIEAATNRFLAEVRQPLLDNIKNIEQPLRLLQ